MTTRETIVEDIAPIPTWLKTNEIQALWDEAVQVPAGGLILEIGTLYGGSAAVLALASPRAKVITIDAYSWHPPSYPLPCPQQTREYLALLGITNVEVRFENTLKISQYTGQPIDLLWIDGGHTYEAAYHDLMLWGPFANVICLHDFTNMAWPGVKQAYDKFHETYVQRNVKSIIGFLAVIKKDPA